MPDCVTTTFCPAMVSVPLRLVGLPLVAAEKPTEPSPVPEGGEVTVSQSALLEATQSQAGPAAAMLKAPVPPGAGWTGLVPLMLKLHGTPGCVTSNGCPPIVMMPERACVLEFAATVKFTVPLPEPLDPEVTVTQLGLVPTLQVQPAGVVTAVDPVPPV